MNSVSRVWRLVVVVSLVVAAGGVAGKVTAAPSTDPPPPYLVYLPVVRAPMQLPSTGFFGMNGSPLEGGSGPFQYAVDGELAYFPALRAKSFYWMNQAGADWYRNYGSDGIVYSWRFVEQSKDTYDWRGWDLLVQEAQSHGISLLASIGNSVPAWARPNSSTDWRDPPADLWSTPMESTSWYKYVYSFVQRYGGNVGANTMPGLSQPIKYWELWNEADVREGWPPCTQNCKPHEFTGSLQDYIRLRQVGYAAVKAADPTAVVVGPATAQYAGFTCPSQQFCSEWFNWIWSDFVNAGGMPTVDIVSFTHYFDDNKWDVPENLMDQILGQVDAARGGKPVWFTETGFNPPDTYQDGARSLVQSAVILWAQPWVQKYFWYDFHEGIFSTGYHRNLIGTVYGTAAKGVEPDPAFHPLYRVTELMSQILTGFDSNYHPAALNVGGAARAYHFSGGGRDVWVAWCRSTSGGCANINLDTGGRTTRVIGLYGQDLGTFSGGQLAVTPDPVYLTTNLNWNPNVVRITGRLHTADLSTYANGVVSATVQISGAASGTTQTDSDGNYVFSNLLEGSYHVSVPLCTTKPAGHDLTIHRQDDWGQTSFTVTVPNGGHC